MFFISNIVVIIMNINIKLIIKKFNFIVFMFIIIGIKIISSISNKIKIIMINKKFIEKLFFILFKLLKPHSMLLKKFFFCIKLFILNTIILINISIIAIIIIEFI